MSINNGTSAKKSDFSGIWDETNKKFDITNESEELAYVRPELGAKVKKRQWGISSVVINFAVFLLVQVILVIIASWIILNQNGGDTSAMLKTLTTSPWIILASAVTMYATWLLGMLYTTHKKGQRSLRKDFGVFMRWYDPLIGVALAGALLGLVALSGWFLGDVLNLNMEGSDNGSTISALSGAWFFIIAIGMASIAGPLFEELFFRGFVLRAVIESINNNLNRINSEEENGFALSVARGIYKARNWIAVIVSSVFFGLMHVQGFETFGQIYVMLATGTLGLVFGICAIKFKRLGPVIFAHMLYNGTTLILATM